MTRLSKKYKYQKDVSVSVKKTKKIKSDIDIFTEFMPVNQRLHAGHFFFLIVQDLYCRYLGINNLVLDNNVFFDFSPYVYKLIGNTRLDVKKILTQKTRNAKKIKGLNCLSIIDEDNFSLKENNLVFARNIFCDLFEAGKIKNYDTINPWSIKFNTYLGDLSVNYKKEKKKIYNIKYFIDKKGTSITIATDSPETIFADVAIVVNPKDRRYKKFLGRDVLIPIVNRVIPIIADEEVDVNHNGGVRRITPGHDEFSLGFARKHGLDIDREAIDRKGIFTDWCGEFAGKSLDEFRDNVIKFLDDIGNLFYGEDIEDEVCYCKYTGEKTIQIRDNVFVLEYDSQRLREVYNIYELEWGADISDINSEISDRELFVKGYSGNPADKVGDGGLYPLTSSRGQKDPPQPPLSGGSSQSRYSVMVGSELELQEIELSKILISTADRNGSFLPVFINKDGESKSLKIMDLVNSYKKSKGGLLMSLLVFNLVLDGELEKGFGMENLLDAFFKPSWADPNISKVEIYLDILAKDFTDKKFLLEEINTLREIIVSLVEDESLIKKLEKILNKSFLIKKIGDNYIFDIDSLLAKGGEWVLQERNFFNKEFLDICFMLDYVNSKNKRTYLDTKKLSIKNKTLFFYVEDNIHHLLNFLVLSNHYGIEFADLDLFKLPYLFNERGDLINFENSKIANMNITSILNNFDSDMLRLLFCDMKDVFKFDAEKLDYYDFWINKTRNAYRYVYSSFYKNSEIKDMKSLYTHIEKSKDKLEDFDIWFLDEMKDFIKRLNLQNPKKDLFDNLSVIIDFSEKLFDIYMEIIKIKLGALSGSIMMIFSYVFVNILAIYMPLFAGKILDLFAFEKYEDFLDLPEYISEMKNYKLMVFVDIIGKLKELRQSIGVSKHERVNMFLKATPDIINFCKEYESILNKLLNIGELDYLKFDDSSPSGYESTQIADIEIGIKKEPSEQEANAQYFVDLRNSIEQKKDELQRKRNLLNKLISSLTSDVLQIKKDEIENMKKEIEKMELKMQN